MQMLADAGVPPMEVIRSATIYGAELVRKERELGTVEPGKLADLVVLSKNPLEDMANTRALETVILDGKIVDTAFHPDYKLPMPSPGILKQVLESQIRQRIDNVEPHEYIAGGKSDLEVELTGKFFPTAKAFFREKEVKAQFVSPRTVRLTIPASMLQEPGTHWIQLSTPLFRGGTTKSNTIPLHVWFP